MEPFAFPGGLFPSHGSCHRLGASLLGCSCTYAWYNEDSATDRLLEGGGSSPPEGGEAMDENVFRLLSLLFAFGMLIAFLSKK
ncbi:MAG TPA: hypothetical protein VFJ73_01885 [Bacillales bacterium]|nr:hypothetical protein [Bacillales bacterium]